MNNLVFSDCEHYIPTLLQYFNRATGVVIVRKFDFYLYFVCFLLKRDCEESNLITVIEGNQFYDYFSA